MSKEEKMANPVVALRPMQEEERSSNLLCMILFVQINLSALIFSSKKDTQHCVNMLKEKESIHFLHVTWREVFILTISA